MNIRARQDTLAVGAGLSANLDAVLAAEQVCERAAAGLGAIGAGVDTDLAVVFFSSHHVDQAEQIASVIRAELRPRCLLGVSAEAVVGGRTELEKAAGVSLLAARLPGVELVPFTAESLPDSGDTSPEGVGKLGAAIGAGEDLRGVFMFVDPFSAPLVNLLPALNRARGHGDAARRAPILGGMASGANSAGGNALLVNGRVLRGGLVGVGIKGRVRIDPVVSHGCRGFGPVMVVTKARKNLILELGGRPALMAVQEAVNALPKSDQALLKRGLFMGRVIDERRERRGNPERFGRDDYLIRNIVGADQESGGIATADFFRAGQTVRLHVRDARTADDDLAMLLDAQRLHEPPAGVMLITCNGRGARLFGRPNHDADAISRAFAPEESAEDRAKAGEAIEPGPGSVPLAGFFAGGEIGPVGEESFLHGHTACLAMFREER
jgi:small ligand-binding sensory domain FIST